MSIEQQLGIWHLVCSLYCLTQIRFIGLYQWSQYLMSKKSLFSEAYDSEKQGNCLFKNKRVIDGICVLYTM